VKISNGDISTTCHPIHLIFGSMVGFSGSADRVALFPVRSNPRWRPWDWARLISQGRVAYLRYEEAGNEIQQLWTNAGESENMTLDE